MKHIDEKEPTYTAFSPATWFIAIQLLMIHWKLAYNMPIAWWAVFSPVLLLGGLSIFGGIVYVIGRGIAYSRSKMSRKPSF